MTTTTTELPSDLRCPVCRAARTLEGARDGRAVYTRCARCGWYKDLEAEAAAGVVPITRARKRKAGKR